MRVLLLAGTTDARELAETARGCPDIELIASFAGRTREQRALPCPVRVGGFGGIDGLVSFMRKHAVDAIVDATHPFSSGMARHARAAARIAHAPHARLVRPPWMPTDQDRWIDAKDITDAAHVVERLGMSPVLLTVGRLDLASFAGLEPVTFVVRTVESPDPVPFRPVAVVRARGPFSVQDEAALISAHAIELLVTKNAGGDDAKLVAARAARLPVVMVQRPQIVAECCFTNAEDTLAWISSVRP